MSRSDHADAPKQVPDSVLTRVPRWLLGLGPLALIVVLIGLFALLGTPGTSGGEGRVPEEAIVVEGIRLEPGQIIVSVRNEGVDPVTVAQVNVSDYYASFSQTTPELQPLQGDSITISYPWVAGDPYEIALITSTGGKVTTEIDAATQSPDKGAPFFGLMVLLGIYVGMIPVGLGMLWMPFARRSSHRWVTRHAGLPVPPPR